jgi:hypothetical protein
VEKWKRFEFLLLSKQTSIDFVQNITDFHSQALVDVARKLNFVVDDQVAFLVDVVRTRQTFSNDCRGVARTER